MQKRGFVQTQTILRALEFALAKGAFNGNARQKKTAQTLLKDMKSTKSASGRYQQLVQVLKKGATLQELMKAAGASRRTVFRYLNQFEQAGVDIVIEDGKYRIQ